MGRAVSGGMDTHRGQGQGIWVFEEGSTVRLRTGEGSFRRTFRPDPKGVGPAAEGTNPAISGSLPALTECLPSL